MFLCPNALCPHCAGELSAPLLAHVQGAEARPRPVQAHYSSKPVGQDGVQQQQEPAGSPASPAAAAAGGPVGSPQAQQAAAAQPASTLAATGALQQDYASPSTAPAAVDGYEHAAAAPAGQQEAAAGEGSAVLAGAGSKRGFESLGYADVGAEAAGAVQRCGTGRGGHQYMIGYSRRAPSLCRHSLQAAGRQWVGICLE